MCKDIMKQISPYLMLVVFFLVLSGCKANYKEISSESDFVQYIGQIYVLKNDMNVRGINLPQGYGETVDVYIVSKRYKVHHKAPEEITLNTFPKGSTFTINGVYECTNCLSFSKTRHISITTEDFEKIVNVPIIMKIHEIISKENVALLK